MDGTYMKMPRSDWWYIVTVIDYYSRYLLASQLSGRQIATAVAHGLT